MTRYRNYKTLTGAVALAGLAVFGLDTAQPAKAAGVLKIANVVPAGAPRSRGAALVAKLVNADDRCDLEAKSYPGAALGGTTDLICLVEGSVCHTAVLPAGGDHLTNDIAVGLDPITLVRDRKSLVEGNSVTPGGRRTSKKESETTHAC